MGFLRRPLRNGRYVARFQILFTPVCGHCSGWLMKRPPCGYHMKHSWLWLPALLSQFTSHSECCTPIQVFWNLPSKRGELLIRGQEELFDSLAVESEGKTILRNVGSRYDTASHPRRLECSLRPQWEFQISQNTVCCMRAFEACVRLHFLVLHSDVER